MNRTLRRTIAGAVAGAFGSAALVLTLGHSALSIAFGVAIGIAYALLFGPSRGAYVDNLMAGAALGIPWWGLINIIALSRLRQPHTRVGRRPNARASPRACRLGRLWFDHGPVGAGHHRSSPRGSRSRAASYRSLDTCQKRASSFLAAVSPACRRRCLSRNEFHTNPGVSLSLISDTNALLFTPMLAEVAGSNLEPSHISTPLRSSLHRTQFTRARVASVDLERRRVILANDPIDMSGPNSAQSDPGETHDIPYDHLVFALGSVSNYLGMVDLEKYSFNFKSLIDAIRIRNHVIEMFEKADRETDPARRRALLTFVIAGGGFAGVELAGAMNDFAHGILADYPRLPPRRSQRNCRPLARSHPPRTERIARALRPETHGRARRHLSPESAPGGCETRQGHSVRRRDRRRNSRLDRRRRAQSRGQESADPPK